MLVVVMGEKGILCLTMEESLGESLKLYNCGKMKTIIGWPVGLLDFVSEFRRMPASKVSEKRGSFYIDNDLRGRVVTEIEIIYGD